MLLKTRRTRRAEVRRRRITFHVSRHAQHTKRMKKSNNIPPFHKVPPPMDLAAFTCLGRLISRIIDNPTVPDISYKDLFEASADNRLIAMLAQRYLLSPGTSCRTQ